LTQHTPNKYYRRPEAGVFIIKHSTLPPDKRAGLKRRAA
jgi:hypothetical protein